MISKKERWFNILSFVNEEYIDESNPLKQLQEQPVKKTREPKPEKQFIFGNRVAISINAKKIFAIVASVCVLLVAALIPIFVFHDNEPPIQKPSEAIVYNQGELMTDVNGNKLCLDKITYKTTGQGATISLSGELEFSNKIYNSTTNSEEYYQFNENTVYLNYKLSSGEQGTFDFRADLFDSQTAIEGGSVTFVFEMDEVLSEKIKLEINNSTNTNVLTLSFRDVMVQGNSTPASVMQYQFLYKNITIE